VSELLTKRKIFQDVVPTRAQGADSPADEVPKSFILRVRDIFDEGHGNIKHLAYFPRSKHDPLPYLEVFWPLFIFQARAKTGPVFSRDSSWETR